MNILPHLAAERTWTLLELSVLAQVTGIVLVAHLIARSTFRRHAAARHGLWLGALACVLISPVVAVVADRAGWKSWAVRLSLPSVEINEPRSRIVSRDEVALLPANLHDELVADDVITENASAAPLVVAEKPKSVPVERPRQISWTTVLGCLTALWGVGILIGVARIVVGYARVATMTRAARPLDPTRHGDALAQARAALGVAELPPVVTSLGAAGPLAVGVFRPRVVLPDGLPDALTTSALRDVLIHECAHLLRRDLWIGLLQRLAAAMVWPHPLVHYLNTQLARAREEVCDNFVLQNGDPCAYSRTLLTLTELYRTGRSSRTGLGLLTARWTLTDRVAGILDPGRMTMTCATVRTRLAVAAVLVATGSIVASLRLESQVKADAPVVQGNAPETGKRDPSTSDLRLVKGITWDLQGIVVDEQGRPVAGAAVRFLELMRQAGGGVSTTAADGTFSLALRPREFVRALVVEVDGGSRVGLLRNDAPDRSIYKVNGPVRIVVKPTRALIVRVRDASGAPVAGASVAAIEMLYQTTASTGPDGLATLRIPADAKIRWVMGRKSQVGLDYFENYRTAEATEIPPLPAEVSLTLDGAQTIRVKAVDSKNQALPGIRFAPVTIYKPSKLEGAEAIYSPDSWVETDAQGIAVFDWLPKSGPRFAFTRQSEEYSAPRNVFFRSGDPTELTAKLLRATPLSGTVRLPDGQPARGIAVRAQTIPKSGPDMGARTGDDGGYSINVPPDTMYAVGVEDENWAAKSRMGILLKEGEPQRGLDFTLGKGTILRGRITEGPEHTPSKGTPIVLIEGGPVLPKPFRTDRQTNASLIRRMLTDENGRYERRVAPGFYILRVAGNDQAEIEVKSEPEIVRDIALKTSPARTYFRGVVVEKTPTGERPVPNAMIRTLSVGESGGIVGRSDEQGRFRSVRLPDTVLYAFGKGADRTLAGFMPVADGADDVKLVVSPTVEVTGRVVDANGKPQPRRNVWVHLDFHFDPSRSAHSRLGRLTTDAQGRFKYPAPVGTEGEFSVNHEKDGQPTGARTVASFQALVLEPVEVTDLIVPASGAPKE